MVEDFGFFRLSGLQFAELKCLGLCLIMLFGGLVVLQILDGVHFAVGDHRTLVIKLKAHRPGIKKVGQAEFRIVLKVCHPYLKRLPLKWTDCIFGFSGGLRIPEQVDGREHSVGGLERFLDATHPRAELLGQQLLLAEKVTAIALLVLFDKLVLVQTLVKVLHLDP